MGPGTDPAWRRVQLARHPKRPHSLDYIQRIFTDFRSSTATARLATIRRLWPVRRNSPGGR